MLAFLGLALLLAGPVQGASFDIDQLVPEDLDWDSVKGERHQNAIDEAIESLAASEDIQIVFEDNLVLFSAAHLDLTGTVARALKSKVSLPSTAERGKREITVAIVDWLEAVRLLPGGREALAKIDFANKRRLAELDKERAALEEKLYSPDLDVLSSRESRKKEKEKLELQTEALESKVDAASRQRAQDEAEAIKPFKKRLQQALTALAERDGFTIVLDGSVLDVLHVAPNHEITASVAKGLNPATGDPAPRATDWSKPTEGIGFVDIGVLAETLPQGREVDNDEKFQKFKATIRPGVERVSRARGVPVSVSARWPGIARAHGKADLTDAVFAALTTRWAFVDMQEVTEKKTHKEATAIWTKTAPVVDALARRDGLALVLERNEVILGYSASPLDATDDVIIANKEGGALSPEADVRTMSAVVVDMERTMALVAPEATKRIMAEHLRLQKELDAEVKAIEADTAFTAKIEDVGNRMAGESRIRKRRADLQEKYRESIQTMGALKRKEAHPVYEKIEAVLATLAKRERFTVAFDLESICYWKPGTNVTDVAVRAYGGEKLPDEPLVRPTMRVGYVNMSRLISERAEGKGVKLDDRDALRRFESIIRPDLEKAALARDIDIILRLAAPALSSSPELDLTDLLIAK